MIFPTCILVYDVHRPVVRHFTAYIAKCLQAYNSATTSASSPFSKSNPKELSESEVFVKLPEPLGEYGKTSWAVCCGQSVPVPVPVPVPVFVAVCM